MELLKLAWAAGFVDGEGYIGLTRAFDKKRGYYTYRPQVEAAQVSKEAILILQSIFGGRVGHGSNKHQGYWYWRTFGALGIETSRTLLPYLVVKRRQAELLLEYGFTDRRKDGVGRWRTIPSDVMDHRRALWAACCELNGGRALRAERLSDETPTVKAEGDAIVRPHGNDNRENRQETDGRLVQ